MIEKTLTKDSKNLVEYLRQLATMFAQNANANTLKFPSMESLVLEYGSPMTAPVSSKQNIDNLAKIGVEPGELKNCFENAGRAIAFDSAGEDVYYAEGYADSGLIPVHHAWLVSSTGEVFDPTWAGQKIEDVSISIDPGTAYHGIVFTSEALRESLFANQIWGVLGHHNKEFFLEGIDLNKTVTLS